MFKPKILAVSFILAIFSLQQTAFALTMDQILQEQPQGQVLGVSTTGLIGYWNFDEGSGSTVSDGSGNGNTGTLLNNPTWSAGKVGSSSLSFNGTSSYVDVPDSTSLSSLEGSNAATISFWVNRANTNGGSYISRYGTQRLFDISSDVNYALRPQWRFGGTGAGGSTIDHNCSNTVCSLPVGTWHHVVAVYNNPTSFIYIDGVLKSSQSGAGGTLNTGVADSLKIGGRSSTTYANAMIDDVYIYNRALSTQEITDLYALGSGPNNPPSGSGDTTAPSVPTGITATTVSSSQINVSWTASTDNIAVTGYKIYRNGSQIAISASPTYNDTSLSPSTTYSYAIAAYDAGGNVSSQSLSVSATTQSGSVNLPPTSGTYTVKQDGTGNYTTIQACANAITAGGTCLVYAGTYSEHVKTMSGGTSDTNRITFKAQGLVTMQGFDIKHAYVTVDGFDIANFSQQWSYNVQIIGGNATYCKIINNTIRDDSLSGGIGFVASGGVYGNNCYIAGNAIKNLGYTFLYIAGGNHIFENNTLSHANSRDYIYVFGHDSIFRKNMFIDGNVIAGVGNHPDWIQTFGNNGAESYNMLFENNWVQNLVTDYQLGQLNSQTDLSPTVPAQLSTLVHDWTFKNNVIINIFSNMNVDMPGVQFVNNTFYRMANQASGIGFGGSLKRGDASRALLKNNAFIGGGTLPDPYGYRGYYSLTGALMSKEVLYPLSADQTIGSGIFTDLITNGYVDTNGNLQAKAKSLTNISQFVMSSTYSSYKTSVYDLLIKTVQLDNSIKNTFVADYNYVAEDAPTYAAKITHCGDSRYDNANFCEAHGVNGGDPKLQNINDPLGPDGLPFTADDGFIPASTSFLCSSGENGTYIGAYVCPGSDQMNSKIYTVKQDGTGNYTTIQACATAVQAGYTCLVYPGNYREYVKISNSGSATASIIIKAVYWANSSATQSSQKATVEGFRIVGTYVTVDGFDITKYDIGSSPGHVTVESTGNYCRITNNVVRNGIWKTSSNWTFNAATHTITVPEGGLLAAGFVPGVQVYIGSNINAQILNHDTVKTVTAVSDTALTVTDVNSGVANWQMVNEGPVQSTIYVTRTDKTGVTGIHFNMTSGVGPSGCIISGNKLTDLAGAGILTINGSNTLVENNTLDNMHGWRIITLGGGNNIFRYNTFKDSPRWDGFPPPDLNVVHSAGVGTWDMFATFMYSTAGTTMPAQNNLFERNLLFNMANSLSQIEYANGSCPANNCGKGFIWKNNIFVGVEGQGSFHYQGTQLVNNTFVNCSRSPFPNSNWQNPTAFNLAPSIHGGPINSVVKNNAFVGCGQLPDTTGQYGWYGVDASDAIPDYNFVAGLATDNYPAKKNSLWIANGFETHGINGGNPKFMNITNIVGPDGIPFTLDDGLKPLPGSPLCGTGEGSLDIGAYSCNSAQVFNVDTINPPTQSSTPTISSFTASSSSIIAGNSTTLSWSVSNATFLSIDNSIGIVTNTTSKVVTPTQTTTYTLTAANSSGSVMKSVTVTLLRPQISNLIGSNTTASSTTISWQTNIPTTGRLMYGLASGTLTLLATTTLSTTHTITLKSLMPQTTYSFQVGATDTIGYSTTTQVFTFTTLATSSPITLTPGGGSSGTNNTSTPVSIGGSSGTTGQTDIGFLPPPVVYIPPQDSGSLPSDTPASQIKLKLININGTYYLIINGVRHGITLPGMLFSYGFSLNQAKTATLEEKALPEGDILLPGDGVLVKTAKDKTVWLISNNQRHGFTSEKVFTALGFKFSQVLVVTAPELNKQARGENVDSATKPHLPGIDIMEDDKVYWIGYDYKRYPYPSLEVYNSWHIPGDFSRVLPANSTDKQLPVGEAVGMRIVE